MYLRVSPWRQRWNLFKNKAVSSNLLRNTETVIFDFSCFSPNPCGILETQELCPRNYFAHKTTYAYLFQFMGCWNIQENLDSDLFWAGDGRSCGGFPPFCILAPQTCQLLELHFLRRIFYANSKSGNFGSQKVARFL